MEALLTLKSPYRVAGCLVETFSPFRILDGSLALFPEGLWKPLQLEWCRLSLFLAVGPGSCPARRCASREHSGGQMQITQA